MISSMLTNKQKTFGQAVLSYVGPWLPLEWCYSFDATEILPGKLSLGNVVAALQYNNLKSKKITHIASILNGALPYYPKYFKYLNLPVEDIQEQNIEQYFNTSYTFIDEAIESGGIVLVHCAKGASRSATIISAYLLRKYPHKYKTANDVINELNAVRDVVNPNPAFRNQLQIYYDKIKLENDQATEKPINTIEDINRDQMNTEEKEKEKN